MFRLVLIGRMGTCCLSVWEPSRCAHRSGQQCWDPASASIHRAAGQGHLVWRKHPKEGREQGCQQGKRAHQWASLGGTGRPLHTKDGP